MRNQGFSFFSARTHEITRNPRFIDKSFLRTNYEDIKDYGHLHVVFNAGIVADVFASELVMGGVHNWLKSLPIIIELGAT
jgi:hypothetical protein